MSEDKRNGDVLMRTIHLSALPERTYSDSSVTLTDKERSRLIRELVEGNCDPEFLEDLPDPLTVARVGMSDVARIVEEARPVRQPTRQRMTPRWWGVAVEEDHVVLQFSDDKHFWEVKAKPGELKAFLDVFQPVVPPASGELEMQNISGKDIAEGQAVTREQVRPQKPPSILEELLEHAQKQVTELRQLLNVVYAERNALVCALSKIFPASVERHEVKEGEEPWDPAWMWVVVIDLPTGQASWHIHEKELEGFEHLAREVGRKWDGHTTVEKYNRLSDLKPFQPFLDGYEQGRRDAEEEDKRNG